MAGKPRPVSERELDLLAYIIHYKKNFDGCAPSMREMDRELGTNSTSTINYYLHRLERFGLIELLGEPRTTRLIRVVGGEWHFEIENSNLEIAI
jgi:SOS-response transcriptional repressor LexA